MQLDKKQESYMALSFGLVLIFVAVILFVFFAGRSTLVCFREANGPNECVYKVQSVFNNEIKRFKVSELVGSNSGCKSSRNTQSNSTNCFIELKTRSKEGTFKMEYGIQKDETNLIPLSNKINKFVEDENIKKVEVSQEGWFIITIVSGVLSFLVFCLYVMVFIL